MKILTKVTHNTDWKARPDIGTTVIAVNKTPEEFREIIEREILEIQNNDIASDNQIETEDALESEREPILHTGPWANSTRWRMLGNNEQNDDILVYHDPEEGFRSSISWHILDL